MPEVMLLLDSLNLAYLQVNIWCWPTSVTMTARWSDALLISATTGIAPTTLTWKWNLRYALLCYAAFVVICIALTA